MRVGVLGAAGRMGKEVCKAIAAATDLQLVLAYDRSHTGERVQELAGCEGCDVTISSNLESALRDSRPETVVELTHPEAAMSHAIAALDAGAAVVIGTSGLSSTEVSTIAGHSDVVGSPVLIVPNFALGAVLMMKFSHEASKYLNSAEIIEMHHDKKADAPSGTAMRTADLIASGRRTPPPPQRTEVLKIEGARGGEAAGTRVHSVRLPGLLAHQQVMFGGPGELLTIRHDSLDRISFMPGVLLAIRNVSRLDGLHVGLESVMD